MSIMNRLASAAWLLACALTAAGASEPVNNCPGHFETDRNHNVQKGNPISLLVDAGGIRLSPAKVPTDLGFRGQGTSIPLVVFAEDPDENVCVPSEPAYAYIAKNPVKVEFWEQGGSLLASVPLQAFPDRLEARYRLWTGSWNVPEGLMGRSIILRFFGKIDDVPCEDSDGTVVHNSVDDPKYLEGDPDKPEQEREFYAARFVVVGAIAGDFIVPGSSRNVVRYGWGSSGILPTFAFMRVYDRNGAEVRFMAGLPTTYARRRNYAEFFWNGLDQSGRPLTQAAAPYRYAIILLGPGIGTQAVIQGRGLKEWGFSFTIPDGPAYPEALRSGIDTATVYPNLVSARVQVTGGAEEAVPDYLVAPVDDEGKPDVNGKNALAQFNRAVNQGWLFYTVPTTPADVPIWYTVKLQSKKGGGLDRAKNEWDMDANRSGTQRDLEWRFKVDQDGGMQKPSGGVGYEETIR